jgi:uncharacterized HAD superfamily protein
MKQLTIAIDIDDVLATSAASWVAYSNEQWGTHLTVEDYQEDWATMWGIEHDEMRKRADHLFANGVVATFPPYTEAKAVLERLSRQYKLVITSSRNSITRQDTLDWLNRHFSDVFSEIHLAGIYDTGNPDAHKVTKRELLQQIGADYLIDDQPKHCLAAAEAGIQTILFGDYAWSRGIGVLPAGVTRCNNWAAVQEYFDGLARS